MLVQEKGVVLGTDYRRGRCKAQSLHTADLEGTLSSLLDQNNLARKEQYVDLFKVRNCCDSLLNATVFFYAMSEKKNWFMKITRLLIIIFLALNFSGCNKTNETDSVLLPSIIGSWELRWTQAGMMPAVNYPEGNSNILKFDLNKYELYSNGQIINSSSYTIVPYTPENNVCAPGNEFKYKILPWDSSSSTFLAIKGDTLTFLSGCLALDSGSFKMYVRRN